MIDEPGSSGIVVSPDVTDRLNYFLRLQFAIIALFWTSIWAVKFSFLIYYKRLFASIPGTNHAFAWRFASFFTILAYVSCQVINLESCTPISNDFHLGKMDLLRTVVQLTTVGACESSPDLHVSNISLYLSTAVDVASDILSKNPAFMQISTLSLLESLGTTAAFALETSNHQEAEGCLGDHFFVGHYHHHRCHRSRY